MTRSVEGAIDSSEPKYGVTLSCCSRTTKSMPALERMWAVVRPTRPPPATIMRKVILNLVVEGGYSDVVRVADELIMGGAIHYIPRIEAGAPRWIPCLIS